MEQIDLPDSIHQCMMRAENHDGSTLGTRCVGDSERWFRVESKHSIQFRVGGIELGVLPVKHRVCIRPAGDWNTFLMKPAFDDSAAEFGPGPSHIADRMKQRGFQKRTLEFEKDMTRQSYPRVLLRQKKSIE